MTMTGEAAAPAPLLSERACERGLIVAAHHTLCHLRQNLPIIHTVNFTA